MKFLVRQVNNSESRLTAHMKEFLSNLDMRVCAYVTPRAISLFHFLDFSRETVVTEVEMKPQKLLGVRVCFVAIFIFRPAAARQLERDAEELPTIKEILGASSNINNLSAVSGQGALTYGILDKACKTPDGKVGLCSFLKQCGSARRRYRAEGRSPGFIDFLQSAIQGNTANSTRTGAHKSMF